MSYAALLLFLGVIVVLMAGFPVAFSLAGTALIFAFGGIVLGVFDPNFLFTLPSRLFGGDDQRHPDGCSLVRVHGDHA